MLRTKSLREVAKETRRFSPMGGGIAPTQISVLKSSYGFWLDGKEQETGSTMGVENPATGEELCRVASCSTEDVNTAVASAKKAFKGWSKMHPRERGRILIKASDILRERLDTMSQMETLQTGRCIREYRAQLARVPEWLEYHAALAQTMEGQVPNFTDEDHHAYIKRVPIGVCALITPWNHPLLIANKKISVCLAAGNTCVVKPPGPAPCSVIELARILTEAGAPPGVINVCPGSGAHTGPPLISHPDIAKVDLTGGTETGYKVGALAGKHAKHYCAELGGNAPVMVFEDCDVEQAINGVAFAAFVAAGQTCVSGKRILIQRPVYDEIVAGLVKKANAIHLADPMDVNTQMGPLVSKSQLEMVMDQVNTGLKEGARLLAGGKQPTPDRCSLQNGYFYEPTILADVAPEMSCFQDEIFGPVISVTPFETEAEAVALANNSPFGLGCSIWTKDIGRAHRVARDTEAGVIWVNAHHRNSPDTPWGGFKESGIGRENGIEAFREYTETKSVVVKISDSKENWFGDANARYS